MNEEASTHRSTRRIVHVTDAAQEEIRRLITAENREGVGLRLGIKGGGCSGLLYNLDFTEARDGDTVLEYDGFNIFLDRKSTVYLSGVTLDHQGGLTGRGFIFRNPHASNTCGCGESFAL
jgi:iron-sulfur cluster assembly protein